MSSGRDNIGVVLFFVWIAAAIGIAVYFVAANPPPSAEHDYTTIEGRIVEVKTGERLVLTWENDDGTFALTFFGSTSLPLPIGENVKLSYHFVDWSSFPFIDNVEVLG